MSVRHSENATTRAKCNIKHPLKYLNGYSIMRVNMQRGSTRPYVICIKSCSEIFYENHRKTQEKLPDVMLLCYYAILFFFIKLLSTQFVFSKKKKIEK